VTADWALLTSVAASVAVVHTLAGPDHYLPFVAMAKARRWGRSRTLWVTAACGAGHIASSILLALLGGTIAVGAERLRWIESARGDLAAWGLIAFGLLYTVWGLRSAWRDRPHAHVHVHTDGTVHRHRHVHHREHLHVHGSTRSGALTPWVLFVVFLLGPCEPLIPILMVPAVSGDVTGFAWLATVFAAITIVTMIAAVLLVLRGLEVVRWRPAERYGHALGGAAVLCCGLAIKFLGW